MRKTCLLLLSTVPFAACHVPTPEEVAAQTAQDVNDLVTEAVQTTRSTNNWSSLDRAYVMGTPVGGTG